MEDVLLSYSGAVRVHFINNGGCLVFANLGFFIFFSGFIEVVMY